MYIYQAANRSISSAWIKYSQDADTHNKPTHRSDALLEEVQHSTQINN